uniref:Uncharacterized protein n=1 Tax=Alexandrium catenella TaxID=2925 RepID=A0A7S1QK15_ALECA
MVLLAGLGLLVLTRASAWVLEPAEFREARRRRAQRAVLCAALPYAVLAAALLAWQAEAGALLTSTSGWSTASKLAGPQEARRREVYKGAHDAFARAYEWLECKGENVTNGHPRHLSCASTSSSYEAKLMQSAVLNICRVRVKSPKQLARLKQCFALGEQLGYDSPGPYSESYGFFCRCWAASLGILPGLASFIKLIWIGEFLGVMAAFYVATEPGLSRMEGAMRSEVVAFGLGSGAFLVLKAVFLRPLAAEL